MNPPSGQVGKKVLLIDDEQEILDLLEAVLHKEGFQQVEKARSGEAGIDTCRSWQPDAIVLDVMLPDIDGFEVCRRLRTFTYAPILFLSARSDDLDKLLGLGIGGDDYVTKPFSPKEVAFRLKAQLRRSEYPNAAAQPPEAEPSEEQVYRFGDVCLNATRAEVTRAGQPVVLTAKEYQLLLFLVQNANRIHSKQKICDAVWGETYIGLDNTITVHIRRLREKLEPDPSAPTYIQTVIGLGYKLSTRG